MKLFIVALLALFFSSAEAKPKYTTGLVKPSNAEYGVPFFKKRTFVAAAPGDFDWEAQGFATPVRNQGNCGSCWAFGSIQTLEGALKIFDHKDLDLSEQYLVGHVKEYYGCGGGWYAGKYLVSGVPTEEDCKYKASNAKCPAGYKLSAKAESFGFVGAQGRKPTVAEVQQAIMDYGYVSVTVGANASFMNLGGGIQKACPKSQTNHMVTLVGWKTVDGKVYFKLKNSWGTGWGDKGYTYIGLGCWSMGEEVAYAVYKKGPCTPPKVKLPSEVIVRQGDEFLLAVKPQSGVDYSWSDAEGKTVSQKDEVEIVAGTSTVIRLTAKNGCGELTIATKITVVQ